MKTRILSLLACVVVAIALIHAAVPIEELAPPLAPLKRLVGKTWQGEFKRASGEKQVFDVMRWERILNGTAIRVVHSVNQGDYGGETTIVWNLKTSRLESYYFTTAGFMTRGVLVPGEGKIVSTEEVVGNASGITEVRAITEFLPDGRVRVKSRYQKHGEWSDGHEIVYEEAPGASVIFK